MHTICNKMNCTQLVKAPERYCKKHKYIEIKKKKERSKRYNKKYDVKRDEEVESFYNSRAWKVMRKVVLERDNHLCRHCHQQGKITVADVVHHIKELKTHWYLRLTKENLLSLCHDCHNKEHKRDKSKGPTLSQRMTRGVF